MNVKAKAHIARAFWLLLAFTSVSFSDTIRITTWNLRSEAKAAPTVSQINAAAETLKTLDPDVILLQGIPNWQFCNELAEALKPNAYNVLACSSFRSEVTNRPQNQVAVLAKSKGYFSWSESWQTAGSAPGGYAFAALQLGNQRLGFFSAQINSPIEGAHAGEQVSRQAASVRNWTMNRVQALLVAASFDGKANEVTAASEQALRALRQAGFVDGLSRLPPELRITFKPTHAQPGFAADCVYLEPSTFAGNVRVAPSAAFEHQPLTCDVELDPTKAAAAWVASAMETAATQRAAALESHSPSPNDPSGSAVVRSLMPWWIALIGGAVLATLLFFWLMRKRLLLPPASTPALLPNSFDPDQQTPSSFTVVLAPHSGTGARPAPAASGLAPHPVIHLERPGATQTQSAAWQQRALAAEARAEQAHTIIRGGLLPHLRDWLKHFLVRKLASDRARLLEAQQAATRKAQVVDERLAKIELQIKEQNIAYGRRIEELLCELASAKEENRELIRQRIAQVRAEMEAARAKLMAQARQSEAENPGLKP
jgi:hypothetical protein